MDSPVEGAPVGDLCEGDQRPPEPTEDAAQFKHFAYQMVNRFRDAVASVFRHDGLKQLRIALFRAPAGDDAAPDAAVEAAGAIAGAATAAGAAGAAVGAASATEAVAGFLLHVVVAFPRSVTGLIMKIESVSLM